MIIRSTPYILFISICSYLAFQNLSFANTSLNIPLTTVPRLDPYMGNDISMNKIVNQVAEPLVGLDDSLAPIPLLAEKWVTNADKKTITFFLKSKKFHDGSRVTSKDVFTSLKKSRLSGSDLTSQIKDFEKCERVESCRSFKIMSEQSFELILNTNNFAFLLRKLAGIEGVIFKNGGNGNFIGTGPYKVAKKTSESILLERVDGAADYKYINFLKVPHSKAVELFKSGKLDTLSDVSYKIGRNEIPDTYPYQDKMLVTFGLVLNLREGIFTDKAIRKALSLAINRSQFLNQYGMNGTPATGLIPVGYLGYKQRNVQHDPKAAKKIIESKLSLKTRTVVIGLRHKYRGNLAIESYLKNALASIGLKLKLKYDSFQNILDDFQKEKYDLIIKGDGPRFYEPSTVFAPYITGQFVNISDFKNSELDTLYYQYENKRLDQDKVNILEKMEVVISEEVPFIPLFHPRFRTWYRPYIDTKNNKKLSIKFWEFPYHRYGRLDVNQRIGGKL